MVRRIAGAIAHKGGVVVSGGAVGVDAAAHEGALEAGGRTWAVLGCGAPLVTPVENRPLFERILASGGTLIRPFPDGAVSLPQRFLGRNPVLVAMSDLVVVGQARIPSGTLNSARWAAALERPLHVVIGAPWLVDEFAGSRFIAEHYPCEILRSEVDFIENVIGARTGRLDVRKWTLTQDERRVVEVLGTAPKHPDELTARTGLPASTVATVLLTLTLGDVVVEGPAGMYRRKKHLTG